MTTDPKGAILVVDDEESIGHLMTSWLSDDGYEVAYANSFDAAQAAFEARGFDLVTLDIIMPDISGLQVLAWIREHHPDTGVIMATALGDLDTVLEAMRAGAVNYLLKPFNLQLVSTEIERAMERQRLIAENRAYQSELERRVEEQTAEIRAAHAELELRVRELQARDRLIQCQMEGPTEAAACAVILGALADVVPLQRAAILRPGAEGELVVVAGADFTRDDTPTDLSKADAERARKGAARARADGEPVCDTEAKIGVIPLAYRQETLGAVWVEGTVGDAWADRMGLLARLGQQGALTLWSAGISAALDADDAGLQELMEIE